MRVKIEVKIVLLYYEILLIRFFLLITDRVFCSKEE